MVQHFTKNGIYPFTFYPPDLAFTANKTDVKNHSHYLTLN